MKTTPLILVPGLLCDEALWRHQVDALGQAAACRVTDRHLRHDTIAAIARAIVADAPPRFALAGLSMGGYIALEICRQCLHRVERLALVDTSARADSADQTRRREDMLALCRDGRFHELPESLYPWLVHPDRVADKALKRRVIDMAHRVGAEAFMRQQHAIIHRIDQRPNLAAIACPTVVICGEQDRITPMECAQEMAAGIRHATLIAVADCGHLSTMEKPEAVSQALRGWMMDGP